MSFSIGSFYAKLRLLDIDDLLLMTMLNNGIYPSDAARNLGLTPPAISHRIKKLKDVFGADIFEPDRVKRIPTEKGLELFSRCERALRMIEGKHDDNF
jgi:predicted transcriptional regulator